MIHSNNSANSAGKPNKQPEKSATPKRSSLQSDPVNDDPTIRPKKLNDIIGRKAEKEAIKIMVEAAKKRNEVVDHVLFYGPPGLGKTTFANAIANEIGSNLHTTSGPAITRQGDLASILTNLEENDVLFIDEIHRLPRSVEEILYPAMEDGVIDIVMGKGPSAKTIRLNLNPFTLVGATTNVGKISSPMRDRFGLIQRLDYFDVVDLVKILERAAQIWEIEVAGDALDEIAARSRGTARISLRLLRRIRDYFQVGKSRVGNPANGANRIELELVMEALELLGVDKLGLEDIDRKILQVMNDNFQGGPVGLSTLAASVSEEVNTIAEVYEPFLMKCGLIQRTSRGRILTESAYRYLGFKFEGINSTGSSKKSGGSNLF